MQLLYSSFLLGVGVASAFSGVISPNAIYPKAIHYGVNSNITKRASNIQYIRNLSGPNLTGGSLSSGYTDLGIPVLTYDNRMFFMCGDTFRGAPPYFGGDFWRAPIGLYSSNPDINNLRINQCAGCNNPTGLVGEDHHIVHDNARSTTLPTDIFRANGKLYMTLVHGVIYETDRTSFWTSTDNGNSWRYLNSWDANLLNYQFQQKSCTLWTDGFVYCISTVFQRNLNSWLLLHAVKEADIEKPDHWIPWGYANGQWKWGNPATSIHGDRPWGEISWRTIDNGQILLSWFDPVAYDIRYQVLRGPTDDLTSIPEIPLLSGFTNVPNLYGGFIMPGATRGQADFVVSQWQNNSDPNDYHFMQWRAYNL